MNKIKKNKRLRIVDDMKFKKQAVKRGIIIIFVVLAIIIINILVKSDILRIMTIDSPEIGNLEENINKEIIPTSNGITIVVDPGHGGRDPGKVGLNGIIEKDINLSIALKLRDHLERNGYTVIMTRTEDVGLYSEGDNNKQVSDLQKRVEIINNSGATLAISIHQNSFQDESCKGGQVFYYGSSNESEIFANIVQEQIKMDLQTENTRLAKADTSYYILKNTTCPIVIVECGFLTNNQEAALLNDEDYQEKMAKTIYEGLDTYIKVKE